MTIFKRYVNDRTTTEQELHKRSGQPVTVLHKINNADEHEVGPMFKIRFADGYEDAAFSDELSEEN